MLVLPKLVLKSATCITEVSVVSADTGNTKTFHLSKKNLTNDN